MTDRAFPVLDQRRLAERNVMTFTEAMRRVTDPSVSVTRRAGHFIGWHGFRVRRVGVYLHKIDDLTGWPVVGGWFPSADDRKATDWIVI